MFHWRNPVLRTLAASLVLLILAAGGARAQFHLDPAYAGTRMIGPALAKGAVIYSHGRSIDSEDSLSPTPGYMAVLRDAGWDAYRFDRMRATDTLPDSARVLVDDVARLKRAGYRRIVLTGQSFGGFLALMAADASETVDAVIATSPAAFGSFSDFYDSYRDNATRLYPLLRQVRSARVMLFFFHGDDFDPGGRGDRARAILAAQRIENLVIDQPPSLTGHWAATTPAFVRAFGQCIRGFAEAAPDAPFACEGEWQAVLPSAGPAIAATASRGPTAALAGTGAASATRLAGEWSGRTGDGRRALLAIDRVVGDAVTAIYAVGPGGHPRVGAQWLRLSGRLVGNELVLAARGRAMLRYRLGRDGRLDAASGGLERGGGRLARLLTHEAEAPAGALASSGSQ